MDVIQFFWYHQATKNSSMENDIQLSIILPVYNGQKIVAGSLSQINEWMRRQKISIELIVVNDGSVDQTTKILNEWSDKINNYHIVDYQINRGKGHAVKKGFEAAKGAYVLFTDTDLSYGLDLILTMYQEIQSHPEVSLLHGSRHHGESDYAEYSFVRKLGRLFFSTYIRALILPDVSDTQCGIKIMMKVFADLAVKKLTVERFAFDIELFVIARANNLIYKAFPVTLENNGESSVKIIKDSLAMLADILNIRRNYRAGVYKAK